MKVGIVTVHDSSNLGSFLQALGMQELVRLQGDTPYLVKTRSGFSTLCLYLGYNNAAAVRSFSSFVRFALSCVRHIKTTWRSYQKYRAYRRDWKQFSHLLSPRQSKQEALDALLLGSDEIWNVHQPAFQNPYFYGIGLPAKRKLAYAISCGNAQRDDLVAFPALCDGIRSLDGIFVRDAHTEAVLNAHGMAVTARICDPTLQCDIRRYMKPKNKVSFPSEPYIAVYAYSVSEEYIATIRRFAREHGLRTVAVSLPQSWCDSYINCSPLEFGAVLEEAAYVFTATFHGTVFSALYHKKFVSLARLPKVVEVLSLLGLDEANIAESADYDTFVSKITCEHDYDTMEKTVLQLRKESQDLYRAYVHEENTNANL